MIKNILKNIFQFIKDSFNLIFFLLRVLYNGNYRSNFKLRKSQLSRHETLAILANGPSLKLELPKLNTASEFEDVDFIVLNYFALEEAFFQIKPKHYCFVDPMFFRDSHRREEVLKLFHLIQNRVDWNMNIYIPSDLYKRFIQFSCINNSCINVVKMNTTKYTGFESFRNFYYKMGLSMPMLFNVSHMAIFVGLNSGYKNINLYGVDHTFFDSLFIDKDNRLCNKQKHFYEESKVKLTPIRRNDNGEIFKISDYLNWMMLTFKSHDYLASYSKSLNIRIVNCTQSSLIDSYERRQKY